MQVLSPALIGRFSSMHQFLYAHAMADSTEMKEILGPYWNPMNEQHWSIGHWANQGKGPPMQGICQ